MTRIVYGVSGEGSGHSSRSREIISYLEQKEHTVKVVSYDRGYKNLRDTFDVFKTEGLHISSEDNRVSRLKTLKENLQKLPEGHKSLRALRREVFKAFVPHCVFTDFEPMTAYLATHYDLPLISVDNQHRLRYMRYPCPKRLKADKVMTKNIIRAMVPRPDVSLVTTFYAGVPKNDHTFLFPPILRRDVLDLHPKNGEHILVYLTGSFDTFLKHISKFNREHFIVYGYDRDTVEGNLQFKPFSKTGFLEDLASCKAVMATAGFTLLTEALHLKKPYLAMPMRGQFEQEINAFFLDRLDYGKGLLNPTRQAIGDFLYHVPDYSNRLESYETRGNSKIHEKIDELLADGCEQAIAFHKKRNESVVEEAFDIKY
jgi:uncharacterized protein (TIGR00661 family)